MLLAVAAVGPTKAAFAHAGNVFNVPNGVVTGKQVQMFLGHSNEPTYGVQPGVHDGKHPMEIFLTDKATSLPLAGAQLKADMFYFKDLKSFNKATSPYQATPADTAT